MEDEQIMLQLILDHQPVINLVRNRAEAGQEEEEEETAETLDCILHRSDARLLLCTDCGAAWLWCWTASCLCGGSCWPASPQNRPGWWRRWRD